MNIYIYQYVAILTFFCDFLNLFSRELENLKRPDNLLRESTH